ncbi:glycerophosphodiester phosphodiesterase [Nocardioides ferulae]|uniref:glycerophosphodiester phosphodiesterase n=1 Tax=Nocardioides ferulae TaxID=2340821 RepID=UPI0013DE67AF|nr:glycerophosphodiester phosphodiesterase family protein [Nocardioides ferulae]
MPISPALAPALPPTPSPLTSPHTRRTATGTLSAVTTRLAVVAHRGASGEAPENTVAAVRLALAQGADLIENDLHRTRDGAIVVHHDATLARTTDAARVLPGRAPWAIADLTLAEVRRVDAGSWFGPAHSREPVPTLTEWAAAVGGRAGMLLEAKRPELYPGLAADLAAELRTVPALRSAVARGRTVVQCFSHRWLRRFAEAVPEVPVGALVALPPTPALVRETASWAAYLNPAATVVDRAAVTRIHDHGLRTFVWTVDRPLAMRRAARHGVDGIITNHPARCRRVLA